MPIRTLNQIIGELKEIADQHRQINNFTVGTIEDFATSGTTNYPAWWVGYDSNAFASRTEDFTFTFWLVDRVKKDRSNLIEIHSDMKQVAMDVIAQLNDSSYGWKVSESVNLSAIYEPFHEDEIAGWSFDFTISQPFTKDVCQIPFISPIAIGRSQSGYNPNTPITYYVPTTRELTIDGITYDLSTNRSWTTSGSTSTSGITSIGLQMPSAFTVSNTPLTANGTLIVTSSGTINQYIDGTGSLQTFPTLTGYVPYTGAIQDVDLGDNKLSSKSVYITGVNGNGHLHLKHQSADATATGQSTSFWADTNGDIKWKNDGNYKTTLKTSLNNADRTYTFPNLDSTLTPDSRLISTTSPLSGGGDLSANRTLSISQSNTSTNGFLSSTDWNTFNGKLDNNAWVDYSATSTIVGWTTFTDKQIKYRIVGKQIFVIYVINGTSNSTATTFTLPNTITTISENPCRTVNNGTYNHGFSFINGTTTVEFYRWTTATALTNTWTASGTKFISGQFFGEVA